MGFIGPNFNQQPYRPQQPGQSGLPAMPGDLGAYPIGPGMPGGGGRLPSLESLLTPMLMAQMSLNPEQVALLLRNLLKMPKDLVLMMAQLANHPQPAEAQNPQKLLEALLTENPTIALEDLQVMMQQKAKAGTEKLMSLLQHQQSTVGGQTGKELGEMLKQLSQLSTKVQASPAETLNQTLLMYLPWVPLEAPIRMQLYFENTGGEDAQSAPGEECNLILLLETLSLGKFKVVIGVREKIQLVFRIEHDALAQPYLADLHGAILAGVMGESLPSPVLQWEARETQLLQQLSNPENASKPADTPKQSLGVYPMGGASVLVVNAAYVAARVILETDRRNALIQ